MSRTRDFEYEEAMARAMNVFWAKGYDGTSIADLAEGMALSRSSIYATFGDKDALFLAALEFYLGQVTAFRRQALKKTESVKDDLRNYLLGVVSFLVDNKHPGGCFFTNTAAALGNETGKVRDVVERGMREQDDDLYACLERGRTAGEWAPERDSRTLATYFQAVLRGITVQARVRPVRKELQAIVEEAMRVLE